MALPGSGPLSMSQVNIELGRPSTQAISLNDSQVRTLAGQGSGAVTMWHLLGKSNVTFTPAGSTNSASPVELLAESTTGDSGITITCNQTAVWNWTRAGNAIGVGQSPANGGSGTVFQANIHNTTIATRTTIWTVNATAGDITRYWRLTVTDYGIDA